MLYRPEPKFSARAVFVGITTRLGLFAAGLAARRADAAYLDRLDDTSLSDLGVRKIEAMGYRRFY